MFDPYKTKQNKINALSTILPIIGFVTKCKIKCVTMFRKVNPSTFLTLTVSVTSLRLKFDNVLFPSFGCVRCVCCNRLHHGLCSACWRCCICGITAFIVDKTVCWAQIYSISIIFYLRYDVFKSVRALLTSQLKNLIDKRQLKIIVIP